MVEPALLRELACTVFGLVPSITDCNGKYVLVVGGRLFMWDEAEQCFRILLSLPLPNGEVDLVTVDHAITDSTSLRFAVNMADVLFRDVATWPSPTFQWSMMVEDIIIMICTRLGFLPVAMAPPKAHYTVRHATQREDHHDKVDVILTLPPPEGQIKPTRVPLQVTLALNRQNKDKVKVIRQHQVALISLNRFLPMEMIESCLQRAAGGRRVELWFMAQVIKGAISHFQGETVSLPIEPKLRQRDLKDPLFAEYLKLLPLEVLAEVRRLRHMRVTTPGAVEQSVMKYLQAKQVEPTPLLRPKLFEA